ncbi:undecaprenyldiphospho-muramoylpentapeptide beta-N-acetylglucosaminyltransferase [Myroides pelagicus]|uniref:undecaprenyldiphospho-muramoylpentapeptide beta-N-acetylglucosaminyltransferase n=1 Tax=Myroides pelagicus TaxID=270914 RepID=UPI002DBDD591|nr:undecaprenyldiphospho-muramoylpentapeptide beta-N-acetylglucosaminyltransferase [Myroides pelagicus]MEC4114519.1 undecaprenyldiphospho-muramoylpentapeptide beta-N-acetylglucosaminyltransferase [Myroides pelagicus]
MNRAPRFILSGGGTGGHIYPALAIANELKSRFADAEILFVGAEGRMEMQKIPEAGYNIEGLWISGIKRELSIDNLSFPFKVLISLFKSRKIVKDFKPDVVIGTGGYASGAVVKVAAMMGIPTVVQEQNSYPGITNKLLAKKAKAVCVAYDGLEEFFPQANLIKTGNPVRQDLLVLVDKEKALAHFDLEPCVKTLLVLGGSLGARKINQLIAANLEVFKALNIQVIWQCGKLYFDEYKQYASDRVKVLPFVDRMDYAFASGDIVISRAGASSVSELAIVGKPVIFIPSPNVAEDHQTKNAQSVVDQGGALMIKESTLENFETVFRDLIADEDQMKRLGEKFKCLAMPNATKDIVNQIEALIQQ